MKTDVLKAKILDLLIKGELTSKWREEHKDIESAEILLEKIRREKEQKLNDALIAKGRRPTAKVELSEISENDKPFEIPDSWKWCRLGDISNYGETQNIPVEEIPDNSWVLELEDLESYSARLLCKKKRSERTINGVRHKFYKGQVLYSKLRPYLNKVLVAPDDGYCTTEIIPISLFGKIDNFFICTCMRSAYFLSYTATCGDGVRMPRLKTVQGTNAILPIPPLEEQKEIARIAEGLLAMVDDVDSSYSNLRDLSKTAKAKILDLLIKGELTSKWREAHKDIESAEILLEKIRSAKEKKLNDELIAKGKKPTAKVELSEIAETNKPFDIPKSWRWVYIGEVADRITDFVASGSFADLRNNVKYYYEPNYALVVRTTDLSKDFKGKLTYTDEASYEFLSNSNLYGGELILPNIGASIGKIFKIPYRDMPMTLGPNAILLDTKNTDLKELFYFYFKSTHGQVSLEKISGATAQAKFNKTDFRKLVIPLPPLEEQKEIARIATILLNQIDSLTDIYPEQSGDGKDE